MLVCELCVLADAIILRSVDALDESPHAAPQSMQPVSAVIEIFGHGHSLNGSPYMLPGAQPEPYVRLPSGGR